MKSKPSKSSSISYSPSETVTEAAPKKSFWDVGAYSVPLRRLESSSPFISELVAMLDERSLIEAKCGKSLCEWSEKWAKFLISQEDSTLDDCVIYGSSRAALHKCVESALERGRAHIDNWTKVQAGCLEPLRLFAEEHLHRTYSTLREAKDLKEDFRTAQQPYIEASQKLKKAHTKYVALSDVSAAKNPPQTIDCAVDDDPILLPPDVVVPMTPTTSTKPKKQKQLDKLRKRYEERLQQLELVIPHYCRRMREIYQRCDDTERKKLLAIKKALDNLHLTNGLDQNPRYVQSLAIQQSALLEYDIDSDLEWWSTQHGPKCKFEEPNRKMIGSRSNSVSKTSHTDEMPPPSVSEPSSAILLTAAIPTTNTILSTADLTAR